MSLDWADRCEEREARWSCGDDPFPPIATDSTITRRPCLRCGGSTIRGALRIDGPLGPWEPLCDSCVEEIQRGLAL